MTLPLPYINGLIIDLLFARENQTRFFYLITCLLFFHGLKYGIITLSRIKLLKVSAKIVNEIKTDMLNRTVRFPMSFFMKHEPGYIVSRINECNALSDLFSTSTIMSFIGIFDLVFSLFVSLYLDYRITLIMLLTLPAIVYMSYKSSNAIKKHFKSLMEFSAISNSSLFEIIHSIEDIKINNYQKQMIKNARENLSGFFDSFLKNNKSIVYFTENISAVTKFSSVILLLLSGLFIYYGELTVGTYVALSQYIMKIIGNVTLFSAVFIQLKPIEVSITRISEFLNYPIEDQEIKEIPEGKIVKVNFRNVKFSYAPDKQILNNISFELLKGKKYRLLGINGVGKSTTLKLISGLYDICEGEITYNELDYNKIDKIQLRKRVGFVSHTCQLYRGTIIDNIFLSNEKNITRLDEIMSKYQLHSYFSNLPDGINTIIVQNGSNLSAGQKQLITILRVIAAEYDLLIFDEPISNVDLNTQEKIIRIIGDIQDKIVVIVSHSDKFDGIENIEIALSS